MAGSGGVVTTMLWFIAVLTAHGETLFLAYKKEAGLERKLWMDKWRKILAEILDGTKRGFLMRWRESFRRDLDDDIGKTYS